MTPTEKPELKECREAFEKWHDKMYPTDKFSEERACAWHTWQAAWNTRATPPDTVTIKREVVERAVGWIRSIVSMPETMNFCGNFSEQYKSGSRDGMRASAVAAEAALSILDDALKGGI